MSRQPAASLLRRCAAAARFALVALVVGGLILAMLGAIAIAILALAAAIGTLLGG